MTGPRTDATYGVDVRGGRARCKLPPLSFAAVSLQCG